MLKLLKVQINLLNELKCTGILLRFWPYFRKQFQQLKVALQVGLKPFFKNI
jgi:hypothetical protein